MFSLLVNMWDEWLGNEAEWMVYMKGILWTIFKEFEIKKLNFSSSAITIS